VQLFRKEPADGGFARPHGAYKKYIVGGILHCFKNRLSAG